MRFSKKQIINQLKSEILDLELKPGTVLSEAVLTNRYNLSRTPVREILKQLSLDGYIDISPQRATRVSYIDLDSVEQIIYLRYSLEKQILNDLCFNFSDIFKEEVLKILKKQEETLSNGGGIKEFFYFDDEFHKTLFKAAGRVFLWDIIQKFNVNYIRYRKLHMQNRDKLVSLLAEHKEIVSLLNSGNRSGLDEITDKHIKRDVNSGYFRDNFREYIQEETR